MNFGVLLAVVRWTLTNASVAAGTSFLLNGENFDAVMAFVGSAATLAWSIKVHYEKDKYR